MSSYEVPEPILNSPFDEPEQHWHIVEGEVPEKRPGRRPAMYFYRDPKAAPIPGYFNIWQWILPQLSPQERGGKKAAPKPEAILKYAHHPIAMLGALWEKEREEWMLGGMTRPPVFILVCKNTQVARVIYEWLAADKAPTGIPSSKLEAFRNRNGACREARPAAPGSNSCSPVQPSLLAWSAFISTSGGMRPGSRTRDGASSHLATTRFLTACV